MRCDAIRYDKIRYDTIRYDTIRYDTIRYDTIRYDTIQYNAIQNNTIITWSSAPLWRHYYGSARHWRIQKFILGVKPRSPIDRWGRSPNRWRKAPEYQGRSPSRWRVAPENWGRSPRRSGGDVWGGGSVSLFTENFWKIKLETIHFGAYLKQLFEMTNEMV